MTEAALPIIEALAVLRERAVRNGHDMAPAVWYGPRSLSSTCSQCGATCETAAYMRGVVSHCHLTQHQCEPTK